MHSAPRELLERGEFLCPACGARQTWSDVCRRCRCDLALFRQTAAAWLAHWRRCLNHLRAGDVELAVGAAEQCCDVSPTREARRLLAVCRLLQRDFPGALAASRRATGDDEGSDRSVVSGRDDFS